MVSVSITSLQHPIVKELTRLRKSASARRDAGEVLIAGSKMTSELSKTHGLKTLLIRSDIDPAPFLPALQIYRVTDAILKKITGLEQPEGVAATLALPQPASLTSKKRLLILDHVADPGNMGTLLRTACALDYDGALLIGGVDPFNDKALRAAKGASFHLPLAYGSFQDALDLNVTLYAGALNGSSPKTLQPKEPYALIVSSESHGLSSELQPHAKCVTIPMKQGVDSLNVAVAGGILLYALDPRRIR